MRSNDYRRGWHDVFGDKAKGGAKPRAKAKRKPPVVIELAPADLDDDLRAALEDAFRRKARKQRIGFDKLAKNGGANWRIACEFSR